MDYAIHLVREAAFEKIAFNVSFPGAGAIIRILTRMSVQVITSYNNCSCSADIYTDQDGRVQIFSSGAVLQTE